MSFIFLINIFLKEKIRNKLSKFILIIFFSSFKILVNFLIPNKKIQDVHLQVFLLKLSNKIQELLFKNQLFIKSNLRT